MTVNWKYRIKRHMKHGWVAQLKVLGIWFTVAYPVITAHLESKTSQIQEFRFTSKSRFEQWKSIDVEFELHLNDDDS